MKKFIFSLEMYVSKLKMYISKLEMYISSLEIKISTGLSRFFHAIKKVFRLTIAC